MIAVLRIDGSGVVVAADATATSWLGSAVGGRCCDVVLARSGARQMVCETTCAARAVRGDGGRWETPVVVRGRAGRLTCTKVGAEGIVILQAMEGPGAGRPPLTPREREVLGLVARGWSTARIAAGLELSPSTVRTHVERIRDKLGARSRAEAVARALQAGELPG